MAEDDKLFMCVAFINMYKEIESKGYIYIYVREYVCVRDNVWLSTVKSRQHRQGNIYVNM